MSNSDQPSADRVIETFAAAADENLSSGMRVQQVVNLPDTGEMIMTGDLHDHRRNFDKLLAYADLPANPDRHLILHELIHGDHYDPVTRSEHSWITLFRAAELKVDFPDRVHFMLANHDLAQIHGEGIMKGGISVCESFSRGLKQAFGDRQLVVAAALSEFLLSLPLGIRASNGIFCCHSLPTDAQIETYDFSVFGRELTGPDYQRRTGPVYQLIWGRGVTAEGAAHFADQVAADIILTGHQPQDSGYLVNGQRHLILASEHNQGVMLPIDLSHQYTMDGLVASLRKFVAME